MAKTHSCGKKSFYGAHQKNFNEARSIRSGSAAECRSMTLVPRNIRYIRIFKITGVPRGGSNGASNDSGVVEEHNFHRLLVLLALCSETI